MTPDDLVQRVARAFCAVDGAVPCDVVCDWCLYRAAPVVAVCMEEAAKIVDRNAEACVGNIMLHDILVGNAAAIRAMIKEPSGASGS